MVAGLAVVSSLGFAGGAAAQSTPTLTLTKKCFLSSSGVQVYGIRIDLLGLAPNEPFQFELLGEPLYPGDRDPGSFTNGISSADAEGNFIVDGFGAEGVAGRYTFTVTWAGGTLSATVTATCPPLTPADCSGTNWHRTGFTSERRCLAYLHKVAICEAAAAKGHTPASCPPKIP